MSKNINSDQIKNVIQHIFDLPTLPTTIARMIEVIDHPLSSAQTLDRIISGDQALAAQILKLANSAYYGFPRKINTITLAIVVLGFETVKNFGLSVSVIDRFSCYNNTAPFDIYLFWEHSICTALASRLLARECGYQPAGEAFATGLLHDLGKYVISLHFRNEFEIVIKQMIEEDIPMFEAEEQQLSGINHAHAGAWLAEKWNLSDSIVEGIYFHHKPQLALKHQRLVWIIHFANYLTKKIGAGFSGDLSTNCFQEEAILALNLVLDGNGNIDEDYYFKKISQEIEKEQALFDLVRNRPGDKQLSNYQDNQWSEYATNHA